MHNFAADMQSGLAPLEYMRVEANKEQFHEQGRKRGNGFNPHEKRAERG